MTLRLRLCIAERIAETIKLNTQKTTLAATKSNGNLIKKLASLLEIRNSSPDIAAANSNNNTFPLSSELQFPFNKLRNFFPVENNEELIKEIISTKFSYRCNHQSSDLIGKVTAINVENPRATKILFQLNGNGLIEDILDNNQTSVPYPDEKRKIVVEFSSPNIAKPFHVGHLRSTIIGNFIAKLHKHLGNDVIRMNYLGDWGTQFGLLHIGVDMIEPSAEEMRKHPIECLYKAYVAANQAAKTDPEIHKRAMEIFRQLEIGVGTENLERWTNFRELTIEELRHIYQRLGVEFDVYAWESEYGQKQIKKVIKLLETNGLLLNENDGRKIILFGERRVPVVKSDGTSLYLIRDIAALLDRFERYKFNKIFYVVDNAQSDHFAACFHVTQQLEESLGENGRVQHIKFGRIKGMSTRSGNVIFLQDVLNEARLNCLEKQLKSPTTKIELTGNSDQNASTADILGVTAVIVNDLKQRRQRDYDFDWEKALQVNGDTGIKLQYTHCRLCSLIENQRHTSPVATNANPKLLCEPEAIALIMELARFSEVIFKAEESLEACVLVNYLFSLSNAISKALKKLNIKTEESLQVQQQRMLLFSRSREILFEGMTILGLKPLEKM